MQAYGSEGPQVQALKGAGNDLGHGLSEAMVRYAVRYEYARTVEDVLARRNRMLFLDAREAARLAPAVAALVTEETGSDAGLSRFLELAGHYSRLP